MPVVASVDYTAKRIYLHSDTVGVDLDTMDVYKEVRALRAADAQSPVPHRHFKPMIIQGGNIEKTPTTKTAKYVQLLYGCRIVPYDSPHTLKVIRDTFTDDGVDGVQCFDRTSLVSQVDINYSVDKVEIVEVNTGGGSSVWTETEKNDVITYSRNASEKSESVDLKI